MRLLGVAFAVALCSVPVWGQDWIFYDDFESGDTSGWWAPARVSETGQVTCYDASGTPMTCAGTGQDGDIRPGVAWPSPRFADNADGTVTDMLTGLVWLKNASCASISPADWTAALTLANALASGMCGLTDGSVAGDWRLPSVNELQSLVDYEFYSPALSNTVGTAKWTEGDAFTGVLSTYYWCSSSVANAPTYAWYVYLYNGAVYADVKTVIYHLWPVRGGR